MLHTKEAGRAIVVTPPYAAASFVGSVTTTPAVLSISTIGSQTQNLGNSNSIVIGPFGAELSLQNDGAQILYVAFASSSSVASSIAAAATGTNPTGAAYAIPPNNERRFRIRPGVDLYMGYVSGASTTTLRAFVTSDQGEGAAQAMSQAAAPAPTISSISPDWGTTAGGAAVTLAGAHFTGASSVTIGGTPVSSFTVVSDTEITATTAASATANADVVVTTSGGTGTLSAGFTYIPASGLTLALFADMGVTTSGSNVTYWSDQSGNAHDFAQTTMSDQPQFSANAFGSGVPGIVFGAGLRLTTADANGTTSDQMFGTGGAGGVTVFAACNATALDAGSTEAWDTIIGDAAAYWELAVTSTNSNSVVFSSYDAAPDPTAYSGGSIVLNSTFMAMGFYDPVGHTLNAQFNSGTPYSGSNGPQSPAWNVGSNAVNIGCDSAFSLFFQGPIGAVLGWSRNLSSAEKIVVGNLLKSKYSIGAW